MTLNILIGVGGTGAKIVEAALHAAVAGLTDNLKVGLVDQDGSNGNVARTCQLLNTICDARAAWRGAAHHHVLGRSPLLAADVQPLLKDPVWTPHPDRSTTLARIFEREAMAPPERALFDALFAIGEGQGDTEQDLPLGKGYRGRPHIGAAAMASRIEDDIPFWARLTDLLDSARGGTEVRILLAGSVFGGTGAAGFPTLARLIRERLPNGQASKVTIGGVLMLPYFDFDPPSKDAVAADALSDNVARSDDLVLQSKSALKSYHEIIAQKVFNPLYLVGWDRFFDLGYHKAGDSDQVNLPLLPEWIAALAAARFFNGDAAGFAGQALISARREAGAVAWRDLPSPNDDPDAAFKAMGGLLRFAVAWKHWGDKVSRPRAGRLLGLGLEPWYKRQRVDQIRYAQTPVEAEVKALDAYADHLIAWAASIEMHARAATLRFCPWNTEPFVSPPAQPNQPIIPPQALADGAFAQAYDEVIGLADEAEALPNAAALIHRLTYEAEADHGQRGLGVFVSALHAFSAIPATQSTGTRA